ncbi:eukaryotic translation initiation factor 3 subunit 2 [Purpureocillium lavendulum]|uniref:Eukaryotic translation initiation factor 3 subunit 2 n=1 Tax=Purpureocillium lavendulum TaxID=1247861 RepID=A0AB34FYC4_9HYPO|nr:eukaryotic translation initiation factor 3 subunit 2 [Purpureocillium lavendulum]
MALWLSMTVPIVRLFTRIKDGVMLNKLIQALKTFLVGYSQPVISDGGNTTLALENDKTSDNADGEVLWHHPEPHLTQMWEFIGLINRKHMTTLRTYQDLHHWSLENTAEFWTGVWDFCGIRCSQSYSQVVSDPVTMWPRPMWFQGAQLNLAENLLFPIQHVSESDAAVISVTEAEKEVVTWRELRERVRRCQSALRTMGVKPGHRVAGYVANHSNALVGMLAAVSLGAMWTAVSPDTGVKGALDRLTQMEPRILFVDNAVIYNGKTHAVLPKAREIAAGLPSLAAVVVFPTLDPNPLTEDCFVLPESQPRLWWEYETFLQHKQDLGHDLEFVQMPAEHPVYILYSSGTTGTPKCIVHGAIGTLMQHKKEHMLQSDIRPGDRLCYITTCMWMMWHWLVSGLASGATVVLYNGSPFYRASKGKLQKDYLAMPKLIDELDLSQFGASATYYSMLEKRRIIPRDQGLSFRSLKAIYSTGSPLAPSTFRYIYEAFGQVNLGSISGGTDIISDFGVPSPLKPVIVGELQAIALGMAVQVWSPTGSDLSGSGEAGELVCVKPFPSQPVCFWGEDGEKKYKESYFAKFPGVWAHGDFIRVNPKTDGLVILGRSDGVLNPSGVRFGSAEIYSLILQRFPLQVEESLCIGRRRHDDTDETVVLFLKMRAGHSFNIQFAEAVRSAVRDGLSPRHVPSIIDECYDIPVTANGKKVEVLIKKILSGTSVEATGGSGVVNRDCLDWYQQWADSH